MLEVVVIACLVAAGISLGFAFSALDKGSVDKATIDDILKKLKVLVPDPVKPGDTPEKQDTLVKQSQAQAAIAPIVGPIVEGITKLPGNLSKLKESVAGLFIAFALLALAGGIAVIDEKVDDKKPASAQAKSTPSKGSTGPTGPQGLRGRRGASGQADSPD